MDTLSKVCANSNCQQENPQPLTNFYPRSGHRDDASEPGHYVSECIACMKARNTVKRRIPRTMPSVRNEQLAIDYLKRNGIYAAPGKSVYASDVDVVAFGCIWIEVKYARYEHKDGRKQFMFVATPKQQAQGYRAHLVMLICDYGDRATYHLFDAKSDVFYKDGHVKSGLTYYPQRVDAGKHGNNRVVMTRGMMDEAQDNINLVWQRMTWVIETLKSGGDVLPMVDEGGAV